MPTPKTKPNIKKYYDPISMAHRTRQGVYMVEDHDKSRLLELVLQEGDIKQTVIISKSKKRADEVGAYLNLNNVKVRVIHGNHRASVHKEVSTSFHACEINTIITTSSILEQLELTNIDHVVFYDIPNETEDYFRTLTLVDELGDISLFLNSEDEGRFAIIEMLLKIEIAESNFKGFEASEAPKVKKADSSKKKKPRHRLKLGKKDKQKVSEEA